VHNKAGIFFLQLVGELLYLLVSRLELRTQRDQLAVLLAVDLGPSLPDLFPALAELGAKLVPAALIVW